jgi:hypothetical protein
MMMLLLMMLMMMTMVIFLLLLLLMRIYKHDDNSILYLYINTITTISFISRTTLTFPFQHV